jgi:DNA invertase Pin-like site-specific DNA recombinase
VKKFVVYKRVSTREQRTSGLGIEAQQRDIDLFLALFQGPYEVAGSFVDTGSGADNDRPEFQRALALARKIGGEIIVSKLDRLSRRVSVIASLMEDPRVSLRVACMPNADKFQLHVYAALAEQERTFISQRTKAALQSAKLRGVKLGGRREGSNAASLAAANRAKADVYAGRLSTLVSTLRDTGKTLEEIGAELASHGISRPRGGSWSKMAVKRLLDRIEEAA